MKNTLAYMIVAVFYVVKKIANLFGFLKKHHKKIALAVLILIYIEAKMILDLIHKFLQL